MKIYKTMPVIEYKNVVDKIPICCVDLIVLYKKKVLLLYRNNEPAKDQWWVPGGRVYKNEKLEEAVIRKSYEEIGVNVKIVKKLGAFESMFEKGPFEDLKNGMHTINVVFVVVPVNDNFQIKIDETSSNYKWIDKVEKSLDHYIKEILQEAKVF